MDRDLIRRIRVGRTTDPDYLSPERAEGVLDEEVQMVMLAQSAGKKEETAKECSETEEKQDNQTGIVPLEFMAAFLRKNPGIRFQKGKENPSDSQFSREQYENDAAFEKTLLQNLERTQTGREILQRAGAVPQPWNRGASEVG